jgi:hypothetical protein
MFEFEGGCDHSIAHRDLAAGINILKRDYPEQAAHHTGLMYACPTASKQSTQASSVQLTRSPLTLTSIKNGCQPDAKIDRFANIASTIIFVMHIGE